MNLTVRICWFVYKYSPLVMFLFGRIYFWVFNIDATSGTQSERKNVQLHRSDSTSTKTGIAIDNTPSPPPPYPPLSNCLLGFRLRADRSSLKMYIICTTYTVWRGSIWDVLQCCSSTWVVVAFKERLLLNECEFL